MKASVSRVPSRWSISTMIHPYRSYEYLQVYWKSFTTPTSVTPIRLYGLMVGTIPANVRPLFLKNDEKLAHGCDSDIPDA